MNCFCFFFWLSIEHKSISKLLIKLSNCLFQENIYVKMEKQHDKNG